MYNNGNEKYIRGIQKQNKHTVETISKLKDRTMETIKLKNRQKKNIAEK
jgi:hypothetical protein